MVGEGSLFDISNVALIPPIPEVHWTSRMTFHLCEAPIILSDKTYAEKYLWHSTKGHYIILDNGAAVKQQVSDEKLAKAYGLIHPDEVVVPDEIANREMTVSRAKVFLKQYSELCNTFMFVPQGLNKESWYACLQDLVAVARQYKIPRMIIGVGKHMHARVPGGRRMLVEMCSLEGFTCHLLGASDEPLEDLSLLGHPSVRGLDTSLPFALAQQGIKLRENPTWNEWCTPPLSDHRASLDFQQASWPLGHQNMETYLRWARERSRTVTSTH